MSTRNQIPLHFQWSDSTGKLTQQAAFFLQQLQNNLPIPGSGFVVAGDPPITIYYGPDIDKSSSPGVGDLYFADDTGKIYISNGTSWVSANIPLFTGDVTNTVLGGTTLTLATVNPAVGTFGGPSTVPVITVDAKGRITNVFNEPISGGGGAVTSLSTGSNIVLSGSTGAITVNAIPTGPTNAVQVSSGGAFYGDAGWTWDHTTHAMAFTSASTITAGTAAIGLDLTTIQLSTAAGSALKILTTGDWAVGPSLAVGTSGQVLTSNGAGTSPSWQTPGAMSNAPNYEEQVASASQTVVSTTVNTTANGGGKAYLQVYVNGVHQQQGATKAYTVTGAHQLTFNTAFSGGEDIVIYAYS